MRIIDSAVMAYFAQNEVYPDSGILTSVEYLKGEPICPAGNASYFWNTADGEPPWATCPNIATCPDHTI